ncbi:MAG: hypothetical protein ACNS64_07590 [Candidatus Halalkalibacterium sp. M3_1C_030]
MKELNNVPMADHSEEKSYTLTPSWKHYFTGYLLSILTIPVAGIGLIALYFVRKKHKNKKYIITDTQISSADSKYHRNVDLMNIENVEIDQGCLQQKLGIGNLILETSASEMKIEGIEDPENLKEILEKAIYAEFQRQEEKKKTKPREPEYSPGSMDKMEYLTGLWQQGLISDEDYEKERKHFE